MKDRDGQRERERVLRGRGEGRHFFAVFCLKRKGEMAAEVKNRACDEKVQKREEIGVGWGTAATCWARAAKSSIE